MVPHAGCVQKRERWDERHRQREREVAEVDTKISMEATDALLGCSICAVIDHRSHMHETCCEQIDMSMALICMTWNCINTGLNQTKAAYLSWRRLSQIAKSHSS